MNAPEVLERITAAGITLTARDGSLIAKPRAAVTPEVLELLKAHKSELLAAITLAPADDGKHAELETLVNRIADYNGLTDGERQTALTIALADHTAALECFRTLAGRLPAPDSRPDDRRRCKDCGNLRNGLCTVERFSPDQSILRRCATFKVRTVH